MQPGPGHSCSKGPLDSPTGLPNTCPPDNDYPVDSSRVWTRCKCLRAWSLFDRSEIGRE